MACSFYSMIAENQQDKKVAAKLGIPHEIVRQQRMEWMGQTVMREILTIRLETLIAERDLHLRKVEPENLKKTQGEIDGLLLALGVLTKKEV